MPAHPSIHPRYTRALRTSGGLRGIGKNVFCYAISTLKVLHKKLFYPLVLSVLRSLWRSRMYRRMSRPLRTFGAVRVGYFHFSNNEIFPYACNVIIGPLPEPSMPRIFRRAWRQDSAFNFIVCDDTKTFCSDVMLPVVVLANNEA
jgi:hypothetical protein